MHEQGEEEKQTNKQTKKVETLRHQEHSLPHNSGEIHNLS